MWLVVLRPFVPISRLFCAIEMFSSKSAIIFTISEEKRSFFTARAKQHSDLRSSNGVFFKGHFRARQKSPDIVKIMADLLENISIAQKDLGDRPRIGTFYILL